PSLSGAVGAVVATFWCGLAFVGRRGAGVRSHHDGWLDPARRGSAACHDRRHAASQRGDRHGCHGAGYLATRALEGERPKFALLVAFWTALAVGVLLKGLPILMIVALAAAALSIVDRSARWLLALRPVGGIVWTALSSCRGLSRSPYASAATSFLRR